MASACLQVTRQTEDAEIQADDARLLGPAFYRSFLQWRHEYPVEQLVESLSAIADVSYARVFAQLHLHNALTTPAVADATQRICCLRSIRDAWGLAIVDAYHWENTNTFCCQMLRWFARRHAWVAFAKRLNRLLYCRGLGGAEVTSDLLRQLRKQWDTLEPLRPHDYADNADFHLDAHGLVEPTNHARSRKDQCTLQNNAFGRLYAPRNLWQKNGDLCLQAVNIFAQWLTKQVQSRCLVLRATNRRRMPVITTQQTANFEAVLQPVQDTTWFIVIKTQRGDHLIDPTGCATWPPWSKATNLRPINTSRRQDSGLLLLGYLEQLIRGPECFLSQLRQNPRIDIDIAYLRQNVQKIVSSRAL